MEFRDSRAPSDGRALAALALLIAYAIFAPLVSLLGFPLSFQRISLMDWQRVLQCGTVSLVVLVLAPWATNFRSGRGFSALHAQEIGWSVFFLLGLLSSTLAKYPRVAILEWSWTLLWFSATALVVLAPRPRQETLQDLVSTGALGCMVSYTAYFYLSNAEALFDIDPILRMTYPGFSNVRILSEFQIGLLFLIPWAIEYRVAAGIWRWCAWLLAGFFAAIVFTTGSRGLVMGLVVAWIVLVLLAGRGARPMLSAVLRLGALGTVVYVLVFVLLPTGMQPFSAAQEFTRAGGSGREYLWQLAWGLAVDHPLLGIGPMHFAVGQNPFGASPHNHILQLLSEWGIPATLLFTVLVGAWTYGRLAVLRRQIPPVYCSLSLAALGGLLSLFALALVSPVFNNPTSQVMLSIFAILAHWSLPERGSRGTGRLLPLVALAGLVIFAWAVAPWIGWIEDRNACFFTSVTDSPIHIYWPRFWQQGWIYAPCEQF